MGKLKRGPHNLFVSYESGEVEFRNNYFKDVNDLYKYKDQWKCSVCSCNLEKSILKGEFCKHPALGVLVCPKCLEYYGDGLFSPDEYGEDKFCRWCAQGGNLYCCSSCISTFCKKCLQRHFKDNRKVMKSLDSEDWKCFLCKSKPIWFLRALCSSVYKFKHELVQKESNTSRSRANTSKRSRSSSSDSEDEVTRDKYKKVSKSKDSSKIRNKSESNESEDEGNKSARKKNGYKQRKREQDSDSEEEESKCRQNTSRSKKSAGPKSKNIKKDTSSEEGNDEETKPKLSSKSRRLAIKSKADSSDDDSDSNVRISKLRPKSKGTLNRQSKRDDSDKSSDEEVIKRTKPGPKSRAKQEVKKQETSDDDFVKKTNGTKSKQSKKSSEEDEENKETIKKRKLRPKSKRAAQDTSDEEQEEKTKEKSRFRKGPKSKVSEKKNKSSEDEDEKKSSKNRKKTIQSRTTRSSRSCKGETSDDKSDGDEKMDKASDKKTTRGDIKHDKAKKVLGPKSKVKNESDCSGHESRSIKKRKLFDPKESAGDDKTDTGEQDDPAEKAASMFQHTLELCDSLTLDIQKKTEKLKKYTSSSKFSSVSNTRKIFSLLFDEMKKNSALFANLGEVVESHIDYIGPLYRGHTDLMYDQSTIHNASDSEHANDVHLDETKPEDNDVGAEDTEMVMADESMEVNKMDVIDASTENVRIPGPELILTSDEDNAGDEEEPNNIEASENKEDSKENVKISGPELILTSDDDETGDNEETNNIKASKNKNDSKENVKIPGPELILTSDDDETGDKEETNNIETSKNKKDDTKKSKIPGPKLILTSDESAVENISPDLSESKTKSRKSKSKSKGEKSSSEVDEKNSHSKSGLAKKTIKEKNEEEKDNVSLTKAALKSILSSDEEEAKAPERAEALSSILSSDDETKNNHGDTEYLTAKSCDESVEKVTKKSKTKRRSSCKDEKLSENENPTDDENDEDENEKKGKNDKKESKSQKKDSIAKLTQLSSLDTTPRARKTSRKSSAQGDSNTEETPKSSRPSSAKKKGHTSLLSFLNEDEDSSAEEIEESTNILSSLIQAKSEEAKRQNEEMIKQGLLRADDESNKEESDDMLSDDEKSKKKGKVKKEKQSSDEDVKVKKEKKNKEAWKNDRLLNEKLSDTDESEAEAKLRKKKAEQDAINLSSDEELPAKKKKKEVESSDDSDFVVKKTRNKRKKTRVRDSSDSEDVLVITSSEGTEEISSDDDIKKNKKKKRSRIKKMKDSDDSSDDGKEKLNSSQGTPGKGRKNIRHILSNEELAKETINASKSEADRKKRIEDRQALYNKLFKIPENTDETITKLVLDFDEKSRTELISVHPNLVSKLKPHQVEGVRFMFNACFESAQQIKKNKAGSGCILAHCMGLGKTLQVVTLVHTLMTHKDLTKVDRVMVVTPLNTVSNWVDEFHNWLKKINNGNDCETFNLIKSKKDYERSYTLNCWFEEGGVLIIGYEMFRNLINKRGLSKKVKGIVQKTLLDPGPDLVVCDEGHILKNEASAVSKAMCQIKSLRRIILTGTPLQNNLEEYHCMVQFIKPNLLGDKKEFKNRFANPINNGQYIDSTPRDVKIMKRRAHVLYKMLDGIVQRRDYNVLTPFLPPKYEYVISIKMTDLQIKLYRHYLNNETGGSDIVKHRLFPDYQALKLVWTHPWTLKSASIAKQKRDDAKEHSESEGSLRDFIDDGDEEEGSNSGSESESGSNSDAPANKKPKLYKTRGAKNRGDVVSDEEEVKAEATPTYWWSNLVTEDDVEDISNSNKLLSFMFVLKQCEEIGDKLLVFSQSLETLSMLEYFLNKIDECSQDGTLDPNLSQFQASWTLGSDYFRLDGSSSSEDRSYWVKSFNNPTNLRARLFLISTKAGGLGINLVAANRVIIFDVSWNPSHDIQSIFRVFRFGQKKPCYIYRFLAQGTMEEKIYDRQVAKQSMSCRVVDEQQIDRHFTRSDISELYEFKPDEKKERKIPALPKDRLMAEMIKEMDTKIVAFHEHDSLLENVQDEELNEEERKAAWEEYESEKSRPAANAGMTYVNDLIARNAMQQQAQGLVPPGGAANLSNLKLDNAAMFKYLKTSNPDVEDSALQKIVAQNAERLEEYKKRQESHFKNMLNTMHQSMQQSHANQMMNKNLLGGMAGMMNMQGGIPGMMNMQGGIPGMMNMQGGMPGMMNMQAGMINRPRSVSLPRPNSVPRPQVLLQPRGRGPSGIDMMRRITPVTTNTPRGPRPNVPKSGPGTSANSPIEI